MDIDTEILLTPRCIVLLLCGFSHLRNGAITVITVIISTSDIYHASPAPTTRASFPSCIGRFVRHSVHHSLYQSTLIRATIKSAEIIEKSHCQNVFHTSVPNRRGDVVAQFARVIFERFNTRLLVALGEFVRNFA